MRPITTSAVSPAASSTSATPDPRVDYDPAELQAMSVIARAWPGKEHGIHISQTYRFANPGVSGIRLRVVHVPGVGTCSCRRWVLRFIQDVNQARAARETVPPAAPRAQSRRLLRDTLLPTSRGAS